jgi:hypothetical protein
MLSPAGGFLRPTAPVIISITGRLLAGPAPETPRNGLVRAWRGCERRGDAMPDNVPLGQWSGSDAMDRLRVAIENHQKATERQTTTTRWLNVVMTALTILMAVPTVVQVWRFAYSDIWPVVRLWRPW